MSSTRARSRPHARRGGVPLRELGIFVALAPPSSSSASAPRTSSRSGNWQNIATDVSMVVVAAVGQTMVVLTRNIDLSVGSIVGSERLHLRRHAGRPPGHAARPDRAARDRGRARLRHRQRPPGGRRAGSRRSSPRWRRSRSTAASVRGHGRRRRQHLGLPAAGNFLDFAARKPLGCRCSRGSRSSSPSLGAAVAPLGALGARPLRDRLEPGRRAPRGHPGRAEGDDGLRDQRRARRALRLHVRGPVRERRRDRGTRVRARRRHGGRDRRGQRLRRVRDDPRRGPRSGARGTIQDGFTLLKISEFWKIFFNGTAIVVAVTVDALITQRLQEALRRRRRAELLAAHERGEQKRERRSGRFARALGRRCSSS